MGIVCNLIADGLKKIEENKNRTNDVLIGKCDETFYVLLDGCACFSTQLEKWCYDTDKLLDAFHQNVPYDLSKMVKENEWFRVCYAGTMRKSDDKDVVLFQYCNDYSDKMKVAMSPKYYKFIEKLTKAHPALPMEIFVDGKDQMFKIELGGAVMAIVLGVRL